MAIVLASGSPRRRELMEMLGVRELRVIPAVGEEIMPRGASPAETVMLLSRAKAREVAAVCGKADAVVGADTVVWASGRILGKPASPADAADMLRTLSGREHSVFTGVTVISGNREQCEAEETLVRFRKLDEREILAYIATGEPLDKAGAYGAQGIASLFVEGITGDFFNVMGLPLCRLGQMLEKMGVRLI